jgi:hypothetical protein
LQEEQRQTLAAAGLSEAEFVAFATRMVYYGVAFATLLYQSGMMLYYVRRRAAVERALEAHHDGM